MDTYYSTPEAQKEEEQNSNGNYYIDPNLKTILIPIIKKIS